MGLLDRAIELPRKPDWRKSALAKRDHHMKAKRKHKKRHSENRERSREEAAVAKRLKVARAHKQANRASFLARARAYWRGYSENHP